MDSMEYKYEKVKKDILKKIEDGFFKAGDRIYSEDEIRKKYSVSSTTAVKALQDLVVEGYLIRRQGEGTFVRKNYKHQRVFFDEQLPVLQALRKKKAQKIQEDSEILFVKVIQDSRVAKKLNIKIQSEIVVFCRIGTLNGKPWTLSYSYIDSSHLKDVENIEKLRFNSLTSFIESELGIRIYDAPMTQNYSILTKLEKKEADLLKTVEDTPVFYSEKINYYPGLKPFQYTETYIHHKYYQLEISTDMPE